MNSIFKKKFILTCKGFKRFLQNYKTCFIIACITVDGNWKHFSEEETCIIYGTEVAESEERS